MVLEIILIALGQGAFGALCFLIGREVEKRNVQHRIVSMGKAVDEFQRLIASRPVEVIMVHRDFDKEVIQ